MILKLKEWWKRKTFEVGQKYACPKCGALREESMRLNENIVVVIYECGERLELEIKNGRYHPKWGNTCKGLKK